MGAEIERLVAADEWVGARRAIRRAMRRAPDDHWLLTRLGLTYYEQRRYSKALEVERRAARIAPHCPLVLWDLAGTLQMLGRLAEAEALYRRLIRRGASRLATGPCGEGMRWAHGLVADCWYRLGEIQERRGQLAAARLAFAKHRALRRFGRSIYEARSPRRPGPRAPRRSPR
jgi:tetratricopeptide (TPR) repeat protein